MKLRANIFFSILFIASLKGAIMEFIPYLSQFDSFFLLITDLLIMILGVTSISKIHKRYFFCVLTLIIISTFNYFSGTANLLSHVNGLREIINIFFIFSFLHFVAANNYLNLLEKKFKKFAIFYLIIQIPICILQFINHNYEAGDWVGGSLGEGGSGTLTLSIFILVFYLIERNIVNASPIDKSKYLLFHFYYFIPCVLNETKITFILIPLIFLSFLNLKKLRSSILGLSFAVFMVFLFSNFYTDRGSGFSTPIAQIFNSDYLENYLAGDAESFDDVPRITKLVLGFNLLKSNGNTFFGQEYGAFKGGKSLSLTQFSYNYQWLLIGSRPFIFYLMLSGGISLIILILYFLLNEIWIIQIKGFYNYSKPLLFFLSSILFLVIFYNDSFRNPLFLCLFSYTLHISKYKSQSEKKTSSC